MHCHWLAARLFAQQKSTSLIVEGDPERFCVRLQALFGFRHTA